MRLSHLNLKKKNNTHRVHTAPLSFNSLKENGINSLVFAFLDKKRFTFVGMWTLRGVVPAVVAATAARGARTKIYTRTGDAGTSALFTGERRAKNDDVFQSLGAVDEVSSLLGLARCALPASQPPLLLAAQIEEVQCRLQDLGSLIATPDPTTRARLSVCLLMRQFSFTSRY